MRSQSRCAQHILFGENSNHPTLPLVKQVPAIGRIIVNSMEPTICISSSLGCSAALCGLPEDAIIHVATFLVAPELLSLLSTHRDLYSIGLSETLWKKLLFWHYDVDGNEEHEKYDERRESERFQDVKTSAAQAHKEKYLRMAYMHLLPSVRWNRVTDTAASPTEREGHVSCVLGNKLVVTGGYSNDQLVHVKYLNPENVSDWIGLRPQQDSDRPSFAYGASLTALDDRRAIRFGGFRSGGYSAETDELALLTVEEDSSYCRWDVIQPTFNGEDADVRVRRIGFPRAYHSATLVRDRYLVIIGGMTSMGSVLNPVVLDTVSWTWSLLSIHMNVSGDVEAAPSGRHGHSAIMDKRRNRLVVFGGGSGSDLLRSGLDRSDVWELKATNPIAGETSDFIFDQTVWEWNRLHEDQNDYGVIEDVDSSGDSTEMDTDTTSQPIPNERRSINNKLSPTETLCLGRCHSGHHVSPDTVMFVFGSGRPSTNGILAYDLARESFFRPRCQGPLPIPRFTCASSFLPDYGCIFFHSGYSTQHGMPVEDSQILDLSPAIRQNRRISSFGLDPHAVSNDPIFGEEVVQMNLRIRDRENRRRGMMYGHEHILRLMLAMQHSDEGGDSNEEEMSE